MSDQIQKLENAARVVRKAFGGARYDESKHARKPKGSKGGGQFAPKSGGVSPATDSPLVSKDPLGGFAQGRKSDG